MYALFLLLALAGEDAPPKAAETIVVTATRSERGVSTLPVSTTVISETDLKAAPAVFVDDVLRNIPGVHMLLAGSAATFTSSQRVSMRGLGGTRALILLDGLPIHDPYQGTIQWQKVPLDTLRQVEVVRGGNSSLFGNYALGGTINLLTRPIDESHVRVDASYGSDDTDRQTVTADHLLTPRLGARVSMHRFDTAGFVRVPNPGVVDVDGWHDSMVANARADHQHSDRGRTTLKANLARIDVSQGTPLSSSNRDIFDLSAGTQQGIADGLLNATVSYQRQTEQLTSTSIAAQRDSEFLSQISSVPARSVGATVEWAARRYSIGVDVQQLDADESRTSFNRSGAITSVASVTGSQRFAGVFAQASFQPLAALEILGSARVDYFKNFNGVEGTTVYPESASTQFDPRFSFRYAIGAHGAVRGSAYRAFKAPTLRELYRSAPTGGSILLGNPHLKPETLTGAEIGVEWATARTSVQANLYRSEIEGLLARAQVPGQPANVFQNFNLGTSRSQGLELMADARLGSRWSFNLGYTYADATIIDDPNPALVGKLLPEVVPHIGTAGIRYRGTAGTTADLRARVLSRSFGEAGNLVAAPAHRIVDLSIAQPVRSWLDVYAMVENALDEEYFYVLTATSLRTGQPRTITGGVRMQLRTRR
jgi:outer membrane cobalamin receptor